MAMLTRLKAETRCQVIIIRTGIIASINEVVSFVVNAVGAENPDRPIYFDYNAERPRTIKVFTRRAGITRAKQLLQYNPKLYLQSGRWRDIAWCFRR